jgi:hypothetical protein
MATERQGKMTFDELDSLNDRMVGVTTKTVNYVAIPDLGSGNVVSATNTSITDTNKSWAINILVDKLVKITCSITGRFFYGLILSNTSSTITFDDVLLETPTTNCTYRIIDTVVLDGDDLNTIVACDIRQNSCGVVLPRAVVQDEREFVQVYNELANNGDHSTVVMCRGTERQLGQKYGELNHKYEGVRLHVHTWMAPHWDVLQTFNIGRYADGNWIVDENITNSAFQYIGDVGKIVFDAPKRFQPINVSGKLWLRYTSLLTRRFLVLASISIEKVGGGNTITEISLAKRDASTGVVTQLTGRIGVSRLSVAGQATISFTSKVDLNHNDEIILIGRRDTGTIIIQTGSGLDVIEI